jgi:hypothetical protein
LAKSVTFQDIADSFPKKRPARPVCLEDMKKAVAQGAAKQLKKAMT